MMISCQAVENGIHCQVGYLNNSDVHEVIDGHAVHRHANYTWIDVCPNCDADRDNGVCQMCRESQISERIGRAVAEIDAYATDKVRNVLKAYEAGKCFLWEAVEQLDRISREAARERAEVGWE